MKTSKIRIITNIITAIVLGFFVLYLAMTWNNIPEIVATHFDASGEANAYGGKISLLIEPVIAVVICTAIAVAECFPQIWNLPVKVTEENRERLINDGLIMMGILKILIAAMLCYTGVCAASGIAVSRLMYVFLGAIVIDIAIGIAKMVKDR